MLRSEGEGAQVLCFWRFLCFKISHDSQQFHFNDKVLGGSMAVFMGSRWYPDIFVL
jgi:hypothetical protein